MLPLTTWPEGLESANAVAEAMALARASPEKARGTGCEPPSGIRSSSSVSLLRFVIDTRGE